MMSMTAQSGGAAGMRCSASRLEAQLPVPIELYDERLTTRLAQRTGGRASEDSRAAAHLLEGWLARAEGVGGSEEAS